MSRILGAPRKGTMRDVCEFSSNSIHCCKPQSHYTSRAPKGILIVNWLWGLQQLMELLENSHTSRIVPFLGAPNILDILGVIWRTSDCYTAKNTENGTFLNGIIRHSNSWNI